MVRQGGRGVLSVETRKTSTPTTAWGDFYIVITKERLEYYVALHNLLVLPHQRVGSACFTNCANEVLLPVQNVRPVLWPYC